MGHKRQRSYVYHSQLLIPEERALMARAEEDPMRRLDVLQNWQDVYQSEHHFKAGDTCYHIDDLEQLLRVDKIIRTFSKNGESQKSKVNGIQVHWFEDV